jgi:tryptophan synthase alpha chain
VLANSSGFVYAVSLTGVTGAALDVDDAQLQRSLAELRAASGCRSSSASACARRRTCGRWPHADGVVVGSALIEAASADRPRSASWSRRCGQRPGADGVAASNPG